MVSFDDVNGQNKINPSKILGFFHYDKNGGIPTKNLMNGYLENNLERTTRVEQIKWEKIRDDTVYAVVQCSKSDITMAELTDDFVRKITLSSNIDRDLYIIDVKEIVCHLFCIPDFGGSDSKVHFISPPHDFWGEHFSNRIPKQKTN